MLQIAKEMKGFVSEVGYVNKISERKLGLKYYSSEQEVDFCGHVTIATMFDLFNNSDDLRKFDKIEIETNKGVLEVENRIISENAVFIMSPKPVIKKTIPEISKIAEKLGIDKTEIRTDCPISIINAGLDTLIVPIKNLDSILNISPILEEIKEFCLDYGFDIIEVFSPNVFSDKNNYRTRVFAPKFGYVEDPATGSGNSAFGYYLLNNNLWSGETVLIEQNGLKENYNVIKLQKTIDSEGSERILFGGGAITRIEGEYII